MPYFIKIPENFEELLGSEPVEVKLFKDDTLVETQTMMKSLLELCFNIQGGGKTLFDLFKDYLTANNIKKEDFIDSDTCEY